MQDAPHKTIQHAKPRLQDLHSTFSNVPRNPPELCGLSADTFEICKVRSLYLPLLLTPQPRSTLPFNALWYKPWRALTVNPGKCRDMENDLSLQ